jgi:hypothetical protein
VLHSSTDPSPYELSKYAISIAAGPEPNLALASELLFGRALSLALSRASSEPQSRVHSKMGSYTFP